MVSYHLLTVELLSTYGQATVNFRLIDILHHITNDDLRPHTEGDVRMQHHGIEGDLLCISTNWPSYIMIKQMRQITQSIPLQSFPHRGAGLFHLHSGSLIQPRLQYCSSLPLRLVFLAAAEYKRAQTVHTTMRTWIVFIVFLLVWSTPICAFTIVTFLHFLEAVVLAARKLVSTFSFEGWHSVFFLQFCAAFVTQGTPASVSFFECVLAPHEATISTTVNVDWISLEFQSHVIPVHFFPE